MTPVDVSEHAFEYAIEGGLLAGGPDSPAGGLASAVRELPSAYGVIRSGGYRKRLAQDYDRGLCLIPDDLVDFVIGTQPKEWEKLKLQHGAETRERFLKRVASEIDKRGTLDVLRNGIRDYGTRFELAYFRPSSGLNEGLRRLYEANVFSVVRQLHYSQKTEQSIDLVLFLNGVPIFTAELKNPLTGQNVGDAMAQYQRDRDPREPLLRFRRCLAHFAVDPDLVYMTTRLEGDRTYFLPFNKGRDRGAGNPPVSPVSKSYPTAYLWEEVWARDSVLNLVQHFIHEVTDDDNGSLKRGRRRVIFPRYHQLDSVRRLIAHARGHGAGERYLIEHSAGSGKSNSIAWLAHQLSVLHDELDKRVFDSIVVITDRRILDRQLQHTVRQFEQITGVVENIDKTSRQLKEALEQGKTIVVSTLQKYPVIADEIGQLQGRRFAVIIDEAHSSQTGEASRSLKAVLSTGSLEEAEQEEGGELPTQGDRIDELIASRGRQPNLSLFAFTATPKPRTLELFGTKRPDGKFEAFSLYPMKQAIEEKFILDVLQNYVTYETYWNLLKTVEDDPEYDSAKAKRLLQSFVSLHDHTIDKKVEIMVEHFADRVASKIGGKAKAMIVTRSRLHAVRYRRSLDSSLAEHGYPYKALVAFSGTVNDDGVAYTEANMNGVSERQTAGTFEQPEYRFLVVANKFQTGFDQPLLHTMYVDKKLGGVNAVQTLSRLNRIHPPHKKETMVLDFANEAEEIKEAFEPYYERTILSEATDPNLLYTLQGEVMAFDLFTEAEVEAFVAVLFDSGSSQADVYATLAPVVDRYEALDSDVQLEFRGKLGDYVRLYAFLSQVVPFRDRSLEKLYQFARLLRVRLPVEPDRLPTEVQEAVDLASLRVDETFSGSVSPEPGKGEIDPQAETGAYAAQEEHREPLSTIIDELNARFGTDFSDDEKLVVGQLMDRLNDNESLRKAVEVSSSENAKLSFDHQVDANLQTLVDKNFQFYKRVTDDPALGRALKELLFDLFRQQAA